MHLFGHHDGRHTHPDPSIPVAVDRDLAESIGAVEAAADDYLQAGTPPARAALVDALARLDQLANLGDDYTNQASVRGLGYGPTSSGGVVGTGATGVLGARGPTPFVDEVPSGLLRAQVELVRCARADLDAGTTVPSDGLRSAVNEVAAARFPEADGPPAPPGSPEPPPRPTPPPPPSPPSRDGPV
jgi:hypothetical protein